MKFIIGFVLGIIIFIIVAPALVVFYFFGSNNPRNLGVTYTPQDYSRTHQQIGTEVGRLASATSVKDSLQYSGKKETKTSLNSAEVSAYLNNSKWVYAPGSKIQVKINADGTGEISGLVNIRNLISYISFVTPTEEIQKALDQYHIAANPPFYAKGTVSVVNNKVNFNIQSLKVGRFPVPQNYVSENLGALNSFASDKLNSIPNLKVRSLTLSDGKVNLDATVPEKVLKLEK